MPLHKSLSAICNLNLHYSVKFVCKHLVNHLISKILDKDKRCAKLLANSRDLKKRVQGTAYILSTVQTLK